MLDLRFALRSLARARGFAIAVILTLGLGIGANTAIFSVVRGVMLKPLPHRDGDKLMFLRQSVEAMHQENVGFSVPEINDFRQAASSFSGIAEYSPITLTLLGEHDAVRIDLGLVTGNYFSVMGLRPVLGRAFGSGDDGPGAAPVMMLTQEYWKSRFGGDSAVIGRHVTVGGKSAEIVGVLEAAPYYPARIDALMNMVSERAPRERDDGAGPYAPHDADDRASRARRDASRARAPRWQRSRSASTRSIPRHYDAGSGYKVTVTPFKEILGQKAQLTLWLLMGAAGFVLIIACANVTNLTLMRGVRREHELTVRAALGAGTTRLRKLLLVENLLLAGAGAALGLAIAFTGVRMLSTFAARYSTRADEISVDGLVLAFTLGLAVIVALILSFAPKLASEKMLGSALTSSGKRATGGLKRARLQQALVVAQVAVSVILLTGAGLLTRTMQRLSAVDSGVKTDHMLTMEVPHDFIGKQDPVKTASDYQHMKSGLAALPGVQSVGMGSVIPTRAAGFMLEINAEGRTLAAGEPHPQAEYRLAGPDYFKTSGITDHEGPRVHRRPMSRRRSRWSCSTRRPPIICSRASIRLDAASRGPATC